MKHLPNIDSNKLRDSIIPASDHRDAGDSKCGSPDQPIDGSDDKTEASAERIQEIGIEADVPFIEGGSPIPDPEKPQDEKAATEE